MEKAKGSLFMKIIDKYIIGGNDNTRKLYSNLRTFRNIGNVSYRKKLAQSFKSEINFEIPLEDGYKGLQPPHQFPQVEEITKRSLELTNAVDVEDARKNKKAQLLTGLLPKEEITLNSPFIKFALNEDVIKSVSSYLGFVPILSNIDVWYSKPSKTLGNSQLFHCDWASLTQMKIFVYATEVTPESGPLVMIPAAESKEIRQKLNYGYHDKLEDDVVEKYCSKDKFVKFLGPKGSMAFADTSRCFHYGSRVHDNAPHRVLSIIQYVSPTDFKMLGVKKGKFAYLKDDSLSELQQMVLDF